MAKKDIQDLAAERAILASICQHGIDAFVDVDSIINVNHFTDIDNQQIYYCLENLINNKKKVDIPSILSSANELKIDLDIQDKNKANFMKSLFSVSVNLENVSKHALKLFKINLIKDMQSKSYGTYKAYQDFTGNETIDEILATAEKPIFDISLSLNAGNSSDAPTKIGDNIEEYLQEKEENDIENIGIPTPFPIYNECIGGGLRTGVNLIASRPKRGKSTISKEVSLHCAKDMNIPVLYLDTEMQKGSQIDRVLASLSDLEIRKVEKGHFKFNENDKRKVRQMAQEIKDIPFFHKNIAGKPFEEILSLIRRWIHKEVGFNEKGKANPHVIIYDYFKLMNPEHMGDLQEYQALGFQISALSDFCQQFDTPVLAFVQINRDGINKDTAEVISQSDRLVWLALSVSIYKEKTPDEIAQDGPENGNMKLVPVETRFGEPMRNGNYINMYMDKAKSKIKEMKTNHDLDKDEETFEVEDESEYKL